MTESTWQLVIVDDHPVVAGGLRQLLEAEGSFSITGVYGSAQDYMARHEGHIDVLVLDLMLDQEVSLDFMDMILAQRPGLKVVIFSMYDNPLYVSRALAAGAAHYLSKGEDSDDLLDVLKRVAAGESLSDVDALDTSLANLSDRELDVLRQLAMLVAPKEIAQNLQISPKTVHAHLSNISEKVGIRRKSELIRFARAQGIVDPGELI